METAEEALEEMWSKKDEEEYLISERLEEIGHHLVTAEDVRCDCIGELSKMDEYQKAVEWAKELKEERTRLRKRLRELNG